MNGSSDFIIKLFDTLKESTDKNERTMQTLINQQQILVDTVKHMPINEIRKEIQDHIESAQKERNVILDHIIKMDFKITKMIITVVVAFSILAGGYLFIRSVVDHTSTKTPTHIQQINP